MDKETNQQQNPSLLPNNATTVGTAAAAATVIIVPKEESPRKPFGGGGGGTGGDRLKRDEWSEGAVSSLLEAYEGKWVLRNRAKLKGHDWEDVARYVSSRANCTKSPKTQTQCKNKIESMKKRYRSESTADASSWPLYSRLDLLLRGGNGPSAAAATAAAQTLQSPAPPTPLSLPPSNNSALVLLEPISTAPPPPLPPPPPACPPPPPGTAQNSHGSNGVDRLAKEDHEAVNKILSDHASDKNISMETTSDSSTPALYSKKAEKMRLRSKTTNKTMRMEKKKRKRKELELDIAESIRWLAEAVVKSEQARMEGMREIERMRVEAEAKRAEMDLKRTEIIANTQLEIARLFAASGVEVVCPRDQELVKGERNVNLMTLLLNFMLLGVDPVF